MSTIECKDVDEKILDYIYEELEPSEHETLRAHVAGCARCQAEIDGFGRVRTAAKSVALVEPPSAASAKLLYQAAQFRGHGKVIPLFSRVVRHPAFAMAAAFVVVGGVAGWQLFNHRMTVAAPEAVRAADEVAADPNNVPPSPPTAAGDEPPPSLGANQPVTTRPAVHTAPIGTGHASAEKMKEKDWAPAQLALEPKLTPAKSPSVANTMAKNDAPAKPSPPPASDRFADGKPVVARRVTATGGKSEAKQRLVDSEVAATPATKAAAPATLAPAPREVPLGEGENQVLAKSVAKGSGGGGGYTYPQPSTAPRSTPQQGSTSLDDVGFAEGSTVLQQSNADERRRDLSKALAAPGRATRSSSAGGPTQAPQAQGLGSVSAAPRGLSPDEEQALVTRLQQKREGDCDGVSAAFQQLKEHFPASLTPMLRFKHAQCERITGHYTDARGELKQLRQEAPQLARKIDQELMAITAAQPEPSPALETARPHSVSKKAKRSDDNKRAADAVEPTPAAR